MTDATFVLREANGICFTSSHCVGATLNMPIVCTVRPQPCTNGTAFVQEAIGKNCSLMLLKASIVRASLFVGRRNVVLC